MGFGLYKPGQGYWVRVMTAAAIAIITFASAGWLMGQMAVLAEKLPVHNWFADIDTVAGSAKLDAGKRVKLMTSATVSAAAEEIGTAEVASVLVGSSITSVKLGSFIPAAKGFDPDRATTLVPADDPAGTGSVIKGAIRKIPPVQPQYLQFAAAGLALLIGGFIAYFFAGVKPSTVEFLIATDMEMKKVNWSTRKDIYTSTMVVVFASFLLAGVLFTIDLAFQGLFKVMGVLQ